MQEIKMKNLGMLTPLTQEEVYSITAMRPGDDDWCCFIKAPHYYRLGDFIVCLDDRFLKELERCPWYLVTPLNDNILPLALIPDISFELFKALCGSTLSGFEVAVYSIALKKFMSTDYPTYSETIRTGWIPLGDFEDEDEEENETEEG